MNSGVSKFGNEKVFWMLYTILGVVEGRSNDTAVPGRGLEVHNNPMRDETNPRWSRAALQSQAELGREQIAKHDRRAWFV